jgi:hypothetical protein
MFEKAMTNSSWLFYFTGRDEYSTRALKESSKTGIGYQQSYADELRRTPSD